MKTLLIDDHWLFLEGMKSLLSAKNKEEDVFITDNPLVALDWIKVQEFDVVLTDLNMPKLSGTELIAQIRKIKPQQKIIVLSMFDLKKIIFELKELGVNGFLGKNVAIDEIEKALLDVCEGKDSFPKEFSDDDKLQNNQFTVKFQLTPKESKILEDLLDNKTNIEIAETYQISPETVKFHRKNIYRKMGVSNVLDLYKLIQE